MWYWVGAMRNLFVRPYLLRERSIGGCASYKVRLLLGARDSLSDLFGWPTFDYQSLHWKRVMPCVYWWNFSGLPREEVCNVLAHRCTALQCHSAWGSHDHRPNLCS